MLSERTIKGYKALAAYLGIGLDSARKLMSRDDFPVIEFSPRVRLIPIDALEDWINNHTGAHKTNA
jgi:hypothetical protein